MKRFGLAILCGFIFYFGYEFTLNLIFALYPNLSTKLSWLKLPLTFPLEIYFYFFRTINIDWVLSNTTLFRFMIWGSAILSYSLLIYLLLTIITKVKRPKQKYSSPPLPPETFN
jgi:hypothetical protein